MPDDWIVDPESRSVDVYALSAGDYELVTRAYGTAPVILPPFNGLALVPESLWPAGA